MKTIYVVKVIKVFNAWFHQGKLASENQIIEIEESPSVVIKDNLILDWEQDEYGFFGVKGEILETKKVEGRDFDETEEWIRFMTNE